MLEGAAVRRRDVLDLLAEASEILAGSFNLPATLPLVTQLCVRNLADYCAIITLGEDGRPSLVQASRDNQLHLEPAMPPAVSQALSSRGFETLVSAPLKGRSGPIGSFILAAKSKAALNGSSDRLASVLASLLAGAIEQSILFERTYRVADRLQRALLPDTLPRVPGALFHAAYRPASDEAEIGGDWYDAFPLPDGRITISMGDVAGHGLEAATVMGEIRQAIRAASVGETSPSAVLDRVNGVINLRPGIGMVTAIIAYYEPQRRELTYALAGHPPPVITVPGAFTGFLPGGGMPLGVESHVGATDWIVTLPPHSGVVFYTDGLTENTRDILAGEELLLASFARAFEADPENPALSLHERIFDACANRDDAATLTLTCLNGPVSPELRFSAVPLTAPIVRAMLHRLCDEYDLTTSQRFSLITAVGEAVANAVEHAYRGERPGEFCLRIGVDNDEVTVEVEDYGRWRSFQRREERGRGIVLMHELMDRVRITTGQKKTAITLTMGRQGSEEVTS